jgi:hypothetical protein
MVVIVRAQATKFKFSMWIEKTQAEERWFFSFGFLYGTVLWEHSFSSAHCSLAAAF